MIERDEIEKQLREIPEQQEVNPSLAADAAALTKELYGVSRKRRIKRNWWKFCVGAATACACLLVGILVPLYYRSSDPTEPPVVIRYYSDDELGISKYDNVEEISSAIELKCKYFSEAQQFGLLFVKETLQHVILTQSFLYVDNSSFDKVNLEVCLTSDEFNRYERHKDLENQKEIDGITVLYMITEVPNGYEILAKCQVDSFRYYWEITTMQGEERLDYYIRYLFGND